MKLEKKRNSEKVKESLLPSRIRRRATVPPVETSSLGNVSLSDPSPDTTGRPQFENETRDAHRILLTAAPQTETTSSTVDTVLPPSSPT